MSKRFPERTVGTPPTLTGVHLNRLSSPLESEENSIQDIPNSNGKHTVSDTSEEAENINSESPV